MESVWFITDDCTDANQMRQNYRTINENGREIFFGVFAADPAEIGFSLPRPKTPFDIYVEQTKFFEQVSDDSYESPVVSRRESNAEIQAAVLTVF